MRTVATFRSSAFNSTESRDYFINPGCFGDDVCKWLMKRLREADVTTDPEPGQEDFGWYFDFELPEGPHSCVVGFRPGNGGEGEWVLWLEKAAGVIGSLLGRRKRVAPAAARVIHRELAGADEIHDLLWHEKKAFDAGDESDGQPELRGAG